MPYADGTEHALQCIALEPVIEQLRNRHGKNAREIDDRLFAEPPNVEAEAGDAGQLAWIPRFDVWRWGDVETLEDGRQLAHARAEVGPLGGVGGTDATNRLDGSIEITPQLEPAAAFQRRCDPGIGLGNAQPLSCEIQLMHDLRWHPADVQRCIRIRFSLDDEHPSAGAREKMRGDETVDARADHDRVVARLGHRPPPSLRIRRAASRPDAPMMPPPGCVPEPLW